MTEHTIKHSLLVIFVCMLYGCATTNPETGEREINRTATGAAIGAGVGAIAGKIIGDDTKAAVIGAGVGAIAGAAVGNYMDKQEKALRDELAGTGVEVERQGDNIKLNMPSGITFDTGKAVIKPAFYPILEDISQTLSNYESTIVRVDGHTDSTGSAEFNQQLSINRAGSVRNYMTQRGVISQRIVTNGYGESLPVADNSTSEGRAANRRVEITLEPITQ